MGKMIQITQRTEVLEQYLRDVKKHPLLTVEEETDLAYRSRTGCKYAFNKLINSNLRFVISTAKEYQYQGIPLMDLIQEGNIGLVKAAQRFDETKGFKFISYAVWWIRQAIHEKLREHNRVIRIPNNKYAEIQSIRKYVNEFMCKEGRVPSLDEIKENVDVKKIDTIDFYNIVSFDAPLCLDSETDRTLLDLFEDEDSRQYNSDEDDLKKDIERIFENFSDRKKFILNHYYGLNNCKQMPIFEIAKKLNLSRERIRQILKNKDKTLATLKRKGVILKKYL